MAELRDNKPSMNWLAADLDREWKKFKQHCMFTFNGPLAEKTEAQKVNYMMTYLKTKAAKYITHSIGRQQARGRHTC
jgi:hypothetical protein